MQGRKLNFKLLQVKSLQEQWIITSHCKGNSSLNPSQYIATIKTQGIGKTNVLGDLHNSHMLALYLNRT